MLLPFQQKVSQVIHPPESPLATGGFPRNSGLVTSSSTILAGSSKKDCPPHPLCYGSFRQRECLPSRPLPSFPTYFSCHLNHQLSSSLSG